MDTQLHLSRNWLTTLAVALLIHLAASLAQAATAPWESEGTTGFRSIPLDQIGEVAQKQYSGDGLSILATEEGAALRCVFQRLDAKATTEGLWITSTLGGATGKPFRLIAQRLGRGSSCCDTAQPLAGSGKVETADGIARFVRPGLMEEYSVSMDGVRQDFVIAERPPGEGPLRVELSVDGAVAKPLIRGVRLVLADGGRKIAYSRLRVADANGRELKAQLEVVDTSSSRNASEASLAVTVDDVAAVYPVRIDPTFSDENWVGIGLGLLGANGAVYAVASDGVGSLYIGGYFTAVGQVFATNIARWNGSSWSALGEGMNQDGLVVALAVSGKDVYAGGRFTTAGGVAVNRVAHWNGSGWTALGLGMDDTVWTLALTGSDLYAGGSFTTADGVAANRIAKWNGTGWSALGVGMDSSVTALAVSGSDLYAGGFFTKAGDVVVNQIARWDGSNWSALGSGVNSYVHALAISGGDVYVGGNFTKAGGVAVNRIAKWNGSNWIALGSGMGGATYPDVLSLAVSGTEVYAGGDFTTAGGVSANRIARWNGSSWSSLGVGMTSTTRALAVSGNELFAGGDFVNAGGIAAECVARWNGSGWNAMGSGMNGAVSVLAVSGDELYAGGWFTTAGNVAANRIAKWNGSSWSALGLGMDNAVQTLAVWGNDLYAGGDFTSAGGVAANRIAKWDGSSWSALGSGMDSTVYVLAASDRELYAGGNFTNAGSVVANRIAKWDGTNWSTLGSGMNSPVWALAMSGSTLYAGGGFSQAGGVGATRMAQWDGSHWSPLGWMNESGFVITMLMVDSNLYVGGWFTTVGGVTANNVAKWDGTRWSALGSGVNERVHALAVSGNNLYAGGDFTEAGGLVANHVAKWDGTNWSALGSGMGGATYPDVYTLAVLGGDLYAGGDFTAAGGKVSTYLARAILPVEPQVPGIVTEPSDQSVLVGSPANFTAAATGTQPLYYQWRRNGVSLVNGGDVSGANTSSLLITSVQLSNAGNYTLVVTNAYGSVTSRVAVLTALSSPATSCLADDFNDDLRDPAKWMGDIEVTPGGRLSETNQHLRFTGTGHVLRPWIGSYGSYTQDWHVVSDVNVGDLVLSQDESYAQVYLAVAHTQDSVVQSGVPGDNFSLALDLWLGESGGAQRSFESYIRTNWVEVRSLRGNVATTSTQASLRISFTAATKTLTAWFDADGPVNGYSWAALRSVQINAPETDWQMSADSTFQFALGVTSEGYTVTASDAVHADNFSVCGGVTPAAGFMLPEYYYPIHTSNEWLYDGTDWDGIPAQTLVRIDGASVPVICFSGRSSPVAYSTNLTRLYSAYGHSEPNGSFVATDTWFDYINADSGWGMWGTDDDPGEEEVRVDGGFVFSSPVTSDVVYARTNDAYLNGTFVGSGVLRLEVLEKTNVVVPAGTFPDCLHLRFTRQSGGTQSFEEWWARGMGMVRHRGISGEGAAEQQELIRASLINPPVPPTLSITWTGSVPLLSITGLVGSDYVLEFATSIGAAAQWTGLVTNSLLSNPLIYPDSDASRTGQRFYRARLLR